MAQFFTDFSGQTTDVAPSGWTERWNTSDVTYTIRDVAGATGGKVLRLVNSASGRRALSWDEVGSAETVEGLVRFRRTTTAASSAGWVLVRGAGAASNETGVLGQHLRPSSGDQLVRINSYASGTAVGPQAIGSAFSMVIDEWYWLRFRAEGTTCSIKMWADGDAEPETWRGTDTRANSGAGWAGIGGFEATTVEYDVIGFGTAGDAAPSEEVGGTPTFTLTTNTVGNGSVTLDPAGGTYDENTVVSATAVPATGWSFDSWSGDLTGSTNPQNVTMDGNKTVTSTFTEDAAPPAAPTGLTAEGGNGQVVLAWSPSAGATSHDVYRHTSDTFASATKLTTTLDGSAGSYTDSTVTNDTTYFYWITATNAIGESDPSTSASATPTAAPPLPDGVYVIDETGTPQPLTAGDGIVHVETFRNTGITDTATIQAAFDAADGRVVSFESGRTYTLTSGLTLNCDEVRGIEGNNAQVKLTTDLVAITAQGPLTSGTGGAGATATAAQQDHFGFYIQNLRVTGPTELGTAVKMNASMNARIESCNFTNLLVGVEIAGATRNVIVADSTIWNCKNYGIWFVNDIHQANISACHLLSCGTGIYGSGADFFNVQVTGCDIEVHTAGTTGNGGAIDVASTTVSMVEIVGNTIEAHGSNTKPLIRFTGQAAGACRNVTISGNGISNSALPAIQTGNVDRLAVTGNAGQSNAGMLRLLYGSQANGVTVVGNTFRDGYLLSAACSGLSSAGTLANLVLSGNSLREGSSEAVSINTTSVREASIVGNVIDTNGASLAAGSAQVAIYNDVPTATSITVSGNLIRGRDSAPHAVRVEPTTATLCRVSDNTATGSSGVSYQLDAAVTSTGNLSDD